MNAKDTIKAINATTNVDDLQQYATDDRKTVIEAFGKKLVELNDAQSKNQTQTTDKPELTVVYPYVIGPAQGNELQLSLRALDKHLQDKNYNVIIIGDKPNFELSDDIIFIEKEHIENASVDFYHKRQAVLAHPATAADILVMYDDIYLVNDVLASDFKEPMAVGKLVAMGNSTKRYQAHKEITRLALAELKLDRFNYSSHSPKLYDKELMTELHKDVPMEDMYIFEDYYYNHYCDDDYEPFITNGRDLKIGVYRPNPNYKLLNKLLPNAWFINNSTAAWTDRLSSFLNALFPDKCKFEKDTPVSS